MSDFDPSAPSRACASCGRRVPRPVAVCRCGARLAAAASARSDARLHDGAADTGAGRTLMALAAAFGGLLLLAIWVWRPAPEPVNEFTAPPVRFVAAAADRDRDRDEAVDRDEDPLEDLSAPAPEEEEKAAAPEDPEPSTPPLEEMVRLVTPAIVQVETPGNRGTAFFVGPDTLITNVHVVGPSHTVTIRRSSGASSEARVQTRSSQFDIAVLKVFNPEPGQAVIRLGSAAAAQSGQEVVAIGSALGTLQNTVTRGIVSAVRQSGGATLVQTDAAVNPGNSGGPLLDRKGQAIGVTTMGYSGRQGLNFAVAAEHVQAVLEGRADGGSSSVAKGLEGLSPQLPSEAEQVRNSAAQQYEQAVGQLAGRADRVDSAWRQFRGSCYQGMVAGTYDREWFALFDANAMRGAVVTGCEGYFSEIRLEAGKIRDAVLAIDEAARRAGVYPGTLREVKRRHRLDYPGWDR